MPSCQVEGCDVPVERPNHPLCYGHWQADKDGLLFSCTSCGRLKESDKPLCNACYSKKRQVATDRAGETLSSTDIGDHFKVSAKRVNLILSELGWIEHGRVKGWELTSQGKRLGAQSREAQSGVPYVVWPARILGDKSLREALDGVRDGPPLVAPEPTTESQPIHERFPAKHKTMDGHVVRSRAEVMIDDWLYHHQIVHAYERKVHIEEPLWCDFWIPAGQVYIEYWGLEGNPEYAARKQSKLALYKAADLKLIEVDDRHLNDLDDYLSRMLIRHGVAVP